MKCELTRIDGWSVIKIVFIVFFLIGALSGAFSALVFVLFNSVLQNAMYDGDAMQITPSSSSATFFFILGISLSTAFAAAFISLIFVTIYNFLARWLGGLRVEFSDIDDKEITQFPSVIDITLPEEV
ncbi:DUF3566 domain-containing protein [candidate division KSB1 bacterium]|nr:DUF3566 domain-containing protein [candidate division KSB1 bacterium]